MTKVNRKTIVALPFSSRGSGGNSSTLSRKWLLALPCLCAMMAAVGRSLYHSSLFAESDAGIHLHRMAASTENNETYQEARNLKQNRDLQQNYRPTRRDLHVTIRAAVRSATRGQKKKAKQHEFSWSVGELGKTRHVHSPTHRALAGDVVPTSPRDGCEQRPSVLCDYIFAVTNGPSNGNNSDLYKMNLVTGEEELVGPIGFQINGLAYDGYTKKLYGNTRGDDGYLVQIDTCNGTGTAVGPIFQPDPATDAFKQEHGAYGFGTDYYHVGHKGGQNVKCPLGRPEYRLFRVPIIGDKDGANYLNTTDQCAEYCKNYQDAEGRKCAVFSYGIDPPVSHHHHVCIGCTLSTIGDGGFHDHQGFQSFTYQGFRSVELSADSKGNLYGWGGPKNPTSSGLLSVNTSNGASLVIGSSGIEAKRHNLAFDNEDVLHLVNFDQKHYIVDTTSSVTTLQGTISGTGLDYTHGDIRPGTKLLYAPNRVGTGIQVINLDTHTPDTAISTSNDYFLSTFICDRAPTEYRYGANAGNDTAQYNLTHRSSTRFNVLPPGPNDPPAQLFPPGPGHVAKPPSGGQAWLDIMTSALANVDTGDAHVRYEIPGNTDYSIPFAYYMRVDVNLAAPGNKARIAFHVYKHPEPPSVDGTNLIQIVNSGPFVEYPMGVVFFVPLQVANFTVQLLDNSGLPIEDSTTINNATFAVSTVALDGTAIV